MESSSLPAGEAPLGGGGGLDCADIAGTGEWPFWTSSLEDVDTEPPDAYSNDGE
jgi:hypothetical protein